MMNISYYYSYPPLYSLEQALYADILGFNWKYINAIQLLLQANGALISMTNAVLSSKCQTCKITLNVTFAARLPESSWIYVTANKQGQRAHESLD